MIINLDFFKSILLIIYNLCSLNVTNVLKYLIDQSKGRILQID